MKRSLMPCGRGRELVLITHWAALAFSLSGLCGLSAAEPPRLVLESLSDHRVRLIWTNVGERFEFQETGNLNQPVRWLPSSQAITLDRSIFSTVLSFEGATRFFRLQDVGTLLTTFTTSPANGETGIAVTRETILTFNQPLAPTTLLASNNLYAEFAGRRILSRIELSSDRRKATLCSISKICQPARGCA